MRGDARAELLAYAGTCCQIFNTILGGGAGMVPLPHALRLVGVARGTSLIFVCGALSAYTACAVVKAGCLVSDAHTLQGVARRTLGPSAAIGVRSLLVAFAFGSGVAALTIFAEWRMRPSNGLTVNASG